MAIYFDIETAPLDEEYLRAIAPEIKAPSNYKNQESIDKYVLAKFAEWIESAALSATTGRVVAVGIARDDNEPELLMSSDAADEYDIITFFWQAITDERGVIINDIIGHNSNRFDLPFLIRRSWILGLHVPPTVLTRSRGRLYLNEHFKDTMDAWACGTLDKISLDSMAKSFGLGAKNGDGALFYKTLLEDKGAAAKYLINDVRMTRACAVRMGL